jgi:hypothetical protein
MVDLGGDAAPMLVPYADNRCPAPGADVDHVAIASHLGDDAMEPEPAAC